MTCLCSSSDSPMVKPVGQTRSGSFKSVATIMSSDNVEKYQQRPPSLHARQIRQSQNPKKRRGCFCRLTRLGSKTPFQQKDYEGAPAMSSFFVSLYCLVLLTPFVALSLDQQKGPRIKMHGPFFFRLGAGEAPGSLQQTAVSKASVCATVTASQSWRSRGRWIASVAASRMTRSRPHPNFRS